jgi:hypothetical protein
LYTGPANEPGLAVIRAKGGGREREEEREREREREIVECKGLLVAGGKVSPIDG